MSFHGVLPAVNEEWLEFFEQQKAEGDHNFKSIFWRLAQTILPEGVDREDPRVIAAIEHIKKVNHAG